MYLLLLRHLGTKLRQSDIRFVKQKSGVFGKFNFRPTHACKSSFIVMYFLHVFKLYNTIFQLIKCWNICPLMAPVKEKTRLVDVEYERLCTVNCKETVKPLSFKYYVSKTKRKCSNRILKCFTIKSTSRQFER